jgi:hypothetical protein
MNSTSVLFTRTCFLPSHHIRAFCLPQDRRYICISKSFIFINTSRDNSMIIFTCLFHDLCECFILRCYAYEGMFFVTFVRDAIYPEGIYRYEGRRTLILNIFRVALFLIRSIWEQVPNNARGRHKLTPPWKGPFVIAKVLKPGTYKLANSQGEVYNNAWNIRQLRRLYP